MILSAHYFRCHIAWGSWGVLSIIWIPDPGNTEICGSEIALFIKDEVFRFDVSMESAVVMEVLKSENNTG